MCHAHTLQRMISLYYQMMTLLTFQHPDFSLKFYNGSPEMLPVISAGLYRHSTFKGRNMFINNGVICRHVLGVSPVLP